MNRHINFKLPGLRAPKKQEILKKKSSEIKNIEVKNLFHFEVDFEVLVIFHASCVSANFIYILLRLGLFCENDWLLDTAL